MNPKGKNQEKRNEIIKYEKAWQEYKKLMTERPDLFQESDDLEIITDEQVVFSYCVENDKTVGVIYKSRFSILVVDLVKDINGKVFTYERLVPANSGGIVCIPVYNGKLVLLKQYRHALREYQLSFPRGFGEPDISSEINLLKEIKEELGADIHKYEHIGKIAPDSGLLSNKVDVYYCEISKPSLNKGYEGIIQLEEVTHDEFRSIISTGTITDGFTLAAYTLFQTIMMKI